MLLEVVEALITERTGTYLDATVGGGGHSEAILERLDRSGQVIAVDRDPEAIVEAESRLGRFGGQLWLLRGRFDQLPTLLAGRLQERQPSGLNGAVFDLGVSSHQIDEASRGFSYHQEGPLDMRMDRSSGVPAAELIAHVSEADLGDIIKRYGEERNARRVARSICRRRDSARMETTADLRVAVEDTHPRSPTKTLARVFQALRIEVNEELGELDAGLDAALELLVPGGRLAVISYHSLEDRLVKQKLADLVRGCICPPKIPVCTCGRTPSFINLLRKARRPSEREIAANSRARSATLRLFEKV